ncbi:MAG: crotonase/enoyl-CoA hydratase family protein [Myxococcota bacterium]
MIELMSGAVTIALHGPVADVRLNRPEKMNAVDPAMWRALSEAGGLLAETKGLRAVVLSGNGRAFCSGLDMASFQTMGRSDAAGSGGIDLAARPADADDDLPGNVFQRAALVWKRLPVPVVAALHGVAFGAGAQIALGADFRIAAPDLRFGVLEIKWGLIPDVGITQTLRDVVRLDVAKELVFTGRIVQAEEALALGLVTRVSNDPLAHATALAQEIASKSPDAIRLGKRLLDASWHADEATGLALEAKLQGRLIGSPNQLEAIRANFEKRAPKFEDPD